MLMLSTTTHLQPLVITLALAVALSAATAASAQEIVAHRGASHDAPENTLAAFGEAWTQGADAIEGDFRLTADGHVVCIHDKTTKRTAGVELDVAKATLAELRKLDVGAWKHAKYTGERIPTLGEVLATAPKGRRILIEIKSGPEIVEPIARIVAASGLDATQVRVIAFDADVIAATRKAMPDVEAYWLTSFKRNKKTGVWSPSVEKVLATLRRVGAHGLDCQAADCVDAAFVARLRDAGMAFHCWTVNDPAVARRFRALGVDSITTDRPAALRAALNDAP